MSTSCGAMRQLILLLVILLPFAALVRSDPIPVHLETIGPHPQHLQRRGGVDELIRPTKNASFHWVEPSNPDELLTYTITHETHSYVDLDRLRSVLNGSHIQIVDVNTDDAFKTDLYLPFTDDDDFKAAERAWAGRLDLIFLVSDELAFEGQGHQSVYRPLNLKFNETDKTIVLHARPESGKWQSAALSRSDFATTMNFQSRPIPQGAFIRARSEDDKDMLAKRDLVADHIFDFGNKTWNARETIWDYE
ncbi:hypothetical protein LTR56_016345 [Elasticomyces elasticus]|nr:hypothetical protein LTR56_016345 [Elasticomyces elasticus]KAK3657679.1 hypothetical protein LTR22_009231 [Elasticomyces elasticus]KAK4922485.1 hypothetical protein LTR49_010185 [Elasticomyces elasticus]KAK5760572.1 hypothetical protein LTS12_009281 [Elasticomyces elasticus]